MAVALGALGLVDSAFSGFRAYAGRDARIRKRRAVVRASLRGLAVGGALLAAADRDRAYASLTEGGIGYLLPLACYALAVLLSPAAYLVLPFRAGTLAMVAGTGRTTCGIRPRLPQWPHGRYRAPGRGPLR
ncbi:hypothetical protein [Streptomyces sp. NPDC091371]|uniref:hypothetical protein n=1 Tax=Streptomyces sp. NPDC091371 TaxID=3155303 RepID=UPI00342CD7C3